MEYILNKLKELLELFYANLRKILEFIGGGNA